MPARSVRAAGRRSSACSRLATSTSTAGFKDSGFWAIGLALGPLAVGIYDLGIGDNRLGSRE